MGACASKDGEDGVQVNETNPSNLPVGSIEMEFPLPSNPWITPELLRPLLISRE